MNGIEIKTWAHAYIQTHRDMYKVQAKNRGNLKISMNLNTGHAS